MNTITAVAIISSVLMVCVSFFAGLLLVKLDCAKQDLKRAHELLKKEYT